jgi:hypothetical protein
VWPQLSRAISRGVGQQDASGVGGARAGRCVAPSCVIAGLLCSLEGDIELLNSDDAKLMFWVRDDG